nr:hypothetical protein [uncultured Holophaga sp.]
MPSRWGGAILDPVPATGVPLRLPLFMPLLLCLPLAAQVTGHWRLSSRPDLPRLFHQAGGGAGAKVELLRHNRIPQELRISQEGGRILFSGEGIPSQSLPLDGRAVPVEGDAGGACMAAARQQGPRLVHTLLGEAGMRETVIQEAGGVLTLRVTVKSLGLDRPVRYTLTYRRQTP